jgi:hypothetical protein
MGINWFNTIFYHGYGFIIPGIIAFVAVYPYPNRSDLFAFFKTLARKRNPYGEEVEGYTPREIVTSARNVWIVWQATKWVIAFLIAYSVGGFLFYPNITEAAMLADYGFGSWSLVPRIVALPAYPASGEEIINLIPTMQAQYYILIGAVGTVLVILGIRFFLRFLRDVISRVGNQWIIDLLALGLVITLSQWLIAPYWLMDIRTPYVYAILITLMAGFAFGIVYFKLSGKGLVPITARKRAITKVIAIAIGAILLINVGVLVYLSVNWNNNWLSYAWTPQIQKQITVTRWAAGLENVNSSFVSSIPTGNISEILDHVRQWDNNASYTRALSQIGVNYLSVPNSEIVYLNGNEYWLQPTTINYPATATDWISEHLIYTHADRLIVIDAHTGSYVSLSQALGVPPNQNIDDPLIYYGEHGGFVNEVYVDVKNEPPQIGGVAYNGAPDYVLSGGIRALWFFIQGPTTWGFAFSPPQDQIEMLYNRDVVSRVSSALVNGLVVDPQTYLVTDGSHLYYAMLVYIDYPLFTGFAASDYLRNFAVVLVDVNDGSMHPYLVDNSTDFISAFFQKYYPSWNHPPPSWLVPQLRYPEQLLGNQNTPGQLDYDFYYHVDTPSVWRSQSDFYERPSNTPVYFILVNSGNTVYYVGLQLAEFLTSQGHNLGGIYIAYGGSRLNQISLYQVNTLSNSTNKILGPQAALQAAETNPGIKTELTLFSNPTLGNVLPYLINGQLYYFIPVYVNTGSANAVITKLAFMVAVDASNGVSAFSNSTLTAAEPQLASANAFNQLIAAEGGGHITVQNSTATLKDVVNAFTSKNLTIVTPSFVNVNVGYQTATINLGSTSVAQVNATVDNFITKYVTFPNPPPIYEWTSGGVTNFGVIVVGTNGLVTAYYISVS